MHLRYLFPHDILSNDEEACFFTNAITLFGMDGADLRTIVAQDVAGRRKAILVQVHPAASLPPARNGPSEGSPEVNPDVSGEGTQFETLVHGPWVDGVSSRVRALKELVGAVEKEAWKRFCGAEVEIPSRQGVRFSSLCEGQRRPDVEGTEPGTITISSQSQVLAARPPDPPARASNFETNHCVLQPPNVTESLRVAPDLRHPCPAKPPMFAKSDAPWPLFSAPISLKNPTTQEPCSPSVSPRATEPHRQLPLVPFGTFGRPVDPPSTTERMPAVPTPPPATVTVSNMLPAMGQRTAPEGPVHIRKRRGSSSSNDIIIVKERRINRLGTFRAMPQIPPNSKYVPQR